MKRFFLPSEIKTRSFFFLRTSFENLFLYRNFQTEWPGLVGLEKVTIWIIFILKENKKLYFYTGAKSINSLHFNNEFLILQKVFLNFIATQNCYLNKLQLKEMHYLTKYLQTNLSKQRKPSVKLLNFPTLT